MLKSSHIALYARGVQTRAGSQTKFLLDESELPRRWYNIRSDMPTAPQPVLHPGTGEPVGPDDLAPLFPMELIGQEVSEQAEISIPDEVLEIYSLWRPTPLFRARRLEEAIGTRSRIFYKYEGVSPPGSHKPNTAVAQLPIIPWRSSRRPAPLPLAPPADDEVDLATLP